MRCCVKFKCINCTMHLDCISPHHTMTKYQPLEGWRWDSWLFNLAWSLLFMRREPFRSLFTHTRMRWYEMKGQPNRDSNPVPPSQRSNHATNWANKAGWYPRKGAKQKSIVMKVNCTHQLGWLPEQWIWLWTSLWYYSIILGLFQTNKHQCLKILGGPIPRYKSTIFPYASWHTTVSFDLSWCGDSPSGEDAARYCHQSLESKVHVHLPSVVENTPKI